MDSDTPQPSSSSVSPPSKSPQWQTLSTLPGAAVCAYSVSKIAPMLSSECNDKRWMWGLAVVALIAVPTLARYAPELVRAVLKR